MNERIRELEKQSCTEVMHHLGGTYMAFDKEKFAELIIKECEQVANSHMVECEGINYGIGTVIKRHFGVK